MKHVTAIVLSMLLLLSLCASPSSAADVKSAGVKGLWSAGTTWVGGAVPGAADKVTIADGDTVTYDMGMALNTTIAGLTVGEGVSGVLQTSKVDSTKLIINGDLLIKAGATFRAQSNTMTGVQGNQMLIVMTGDLTFVGKLFDTRTGSSGSTLGVINFEFVGSTNTTITTTPDVAGLAVVNYEFNGITINKSGNARVTLASDIYCTGGSSSAPYLSAILRMLRGKIYTGTFAFITTTTTGANIHGYSDSCYVIGAMGRGMSSVGTTREFPVGDSRGYRPVKIRSVSALAGTGCWVEVRTVEANANTGTSVLTGNVDKVAAGRYYKVDFRKGTQATANLSVPWFSIGYGLNDGVANASANLRTAYSVDGRANWIGLGPTAIPYTTSLVDSLPRFIQSDSLKTAVVLADAGASMYLALARATGTTDNSLVIPATSVEQTSSAVPATFALGQNYPNPFNPSTAITYSLPAAGRVTLTVYTMLGQRVATLVNTVQNAGTYTASFDASRLASGMYLYRIEAGSFSSVKKMMLMK